MWLTCQHVTQQTRPKWQKAERRVLCVNGSDSVCERLLDMKVWSVSAQPSARKLLMCCSDFTNVSLWDVRKHEFALSFSFNIMNTNYQKLPFSVAIKTSQLFITGTVKPWTSVSLSCLCGSLAPKSPLLHSNSSFPRSKCIRHQQNRHTY